MAPKPGKRRTTTDDIDEDEDDPPNGGSFTDAQRDELNRLVNASVGSQLNRKLKPALEGAMSPVLERLEAIAAGKPAGEKPAAAEGGKKPEGESDREREWRAKVEEQDRKIAKMDAERKAERDGARSAKRDSTLREELGKHGVDPLRMKGALAVIRDAVKIDEKTGDISYLAQRDGYTEELDVSKGVKEWAESDEGKAYRATPQKGQQRTVVTGAVNVVGTGALKGAESKARAQEQRTERKTEALDKLGAAVGSLIGGANLDLGS